MITIEVKRVAHGGKSETRSERKLTFSSDAPFKTEIIPTLLKIQEFSCGSVLWVDSGTRYRRTTIQGKDSVLMAPVKICNSGISDNLSSLIEDMLRSVKVPVVNARGERFEISLTQKAVALDSAAKAELDGEKESSSGGKITPLAVNSSCTGKAALFAEVAGYAPKRVTSRL